jgi:glucokinase
MQIFAIDLGGTNCRAAIINSDGSIEGRRQRPTPRAAGGPEIAELMARMAAELRADALKITAAGVAVPANVTSDGILRRLPNLPALEGAKLGDLLEQKLAVPVAVENDATAAAIGEAWVGVSSGVENSVLVTLGTGVGGGIFVNGTPLRGLDGGAAKIGHITVEPDGHPCGCGSVGCVEQYASAPALIRLASEQGLEVESARELFELWQAGDEKAAAAFVAIGRYLGIMLGSVVNTLNPEMIIIGGGVSASWDAFIEPLRREIKLRAFPEPAARARVVRSKLGDDAGMIGAARSALVTLLGQ